MWNLFTKSKDKKNSDASKAILAMMGFDTAIQRVRDLERLGKHEDANSLFVSLIRAVAKVLRGDARGFSVLLKALDEATARGSNDLERIVMEAIEANPKGKTSEGAAVIEALARSRTGKADAQRRQDLQTYICQRCGAVILHLSTPCSDCSFVPSSTDEAAKGIFLSTAYIAAPYLFTFGERIHRGFEFDQLHSDFVDQFQSMKDEPQVKDAARQILNYCARINIANYRPISGLALCERCGVKSRVHFWTMRCAQCGSESLRIPPAGLYKLVLRDCLLWLQRVPEPADNPALILFIHQLATLKERAVENSIFVQRDEGFKLKRGLEEVGEITSRDSRYRLRFSPQGAFGEPLIKGFDASRDPDRLSSFGPPLFNKLGEFFYQGVPVE